jgi:uncharacterized membrane protein
MRTKSAIGGFAAGAAVMYFADRRCGARRRAVARDKIAAGLHRLGIELGKAERDTANRATGLKAEILRMLRGRPVDDAALTERVRARIGHVISNPHAIRVGADAQGRVTISGPVLADEMRDLLSAAKSTPGVHEMIECLEPHTEAERIPDLQGNRRRRPAPWNRGRWTPAARAGAGALGGVALIGGMCSKGRAGWLTTAAGAALMTRAASNKSFAEIFGVGDANTIHIDKSIHISAPLEVVYAFWSNSENFPQFMSHIKEVRNLGNGRSRWVAQGPAGVSVAWEAEVIDQTENARLAWRSVPGSVVRTAGEVRFALEQDLSTRVDIHMSYTPPAGFIGHVIASLCGSDPKSEMDDDLIRLKSLLERGKTRANGHTVTLDQVAG